MTSIALRCLGGQPVPERMLADLRRLVDLTAEAWAEFPDLLAAALPEPPPAAVEARIPAFALRHRLDPELVAVGLRGARFLLRSAAERDLGAVDFALDLGALGGALALDLETPLVRGFEVAKAVVHRELLARAMAGHGRVLVGADWRLDLIARSPAAPTLRAPVAVLTLRYVEEGRERTITFSATSETVQELGRACSALLSS